MKLPRLSTISDKVEAKAQKIKDTGRWRDLTAYWIIGLCNNYGYVVMLTAAHDIIARFSPVSMMRVYPNSSKQSNARTFHLFLNLFQLQPDHSDTNNPRKCNIMSTGAILLADILPSLCVKSVIAFMPFYIK